MRTLRIPLLVLALVGLIAVGGCGGGDDSTSSSTTATDSSSTTATDTTATDTTATESTTTTSGEALSADEYSQQAQQVLVAFATQFTQLDPQIQQASSVEQFSTLIDQAETEIQGVIDDFGALTPPPEAQEGHDQILAALEDFSSKLTDVSDAAESGDKSALKDSAKALQAAGTDFETQLQEAAQSLTDAGIDLGGASSGG